MQAPLKLVGALRRASRPLVLAGGAPRRWAATAAPESPEALGLSSPGNSGTSKEMKEAGRPSEVADNERAHQMHLFSEKACFDGTALVNAQPPAGDADAPADTAPDRDVGEESRRLGRQGAAEARPLNIEGYPDLVQRYHPRRGMTSSAGAREAGEAGPRRLGK